MSENYEETGFHTFLTYASGPRVDEGDPLPWTWSTWRSELNLIEPTVNDVFYTIDPLPCDPRDVVVKLENFYGENEPMPEDEELVHCDLVSGTRLRYLTRGFDGTVPQYHYRWEGPPYHKGAHTRVTLMRRKSAPAERQTTSDPRH